VTTCKDSLYINARGHLYHDGEGTHCGCGARCASGTRCGTGARVVGVLHAYLPRANWAALGPAVHLGTGRVGPSRASPVVGCVGTPVGVGVTRDGSLALCGCGPRPACTRRPLSLVWLWRRVKCALGFSSLGVVVQELCLSVGSCHWSCASSWVQPYWGWPRWLSSPLPVFISLWA